MPLPAYPRRSLVSRFGIACAAVACSTALLGGGLGLFERQARLGAEAQATLSSSKKMEAINASAKAQPTVDGKAPAGALAYRETD